jgi:hypothetical protein
MNNEKGLKQKIKDGEISPDEAITSVAKSETPSDNFIRWADGPGRKRYAQALKSKEAEVVETPVKQKTAKKKAKKSE